MWALMLWGLLTGALAAWIFLLPQAPEPMGYQGTFDVFELVGSIVYFGLVCVALVVVLLVRFFVDRSEAPKQDRGFEVRMMDPRE